MKFTTENQPANRRKPNPLTGRLKKLLNEAHTGDTTKADAILQTLINEAIGGNIKAIQLIYERLEGKPAQSLELLQPDVKTALPTVIVIEKPSDYLPPVYDESEILAMEAERKNIQPKLNK